MAGAGGGGGSEKVTFFGLTIQILLRQLSCWVENCWARLRLQSARASLEQFPSGLCQEEPLCPPARGLLNLSEEVALLPQTQNYILK